MNETIASRLFSLLIKAFAHQPTKGQEEALKRIANFVEKSTSGDTYLLKGYAGTGKTTIISALVRTLPSIGLKVSLLAPTGRAAKVMSTYSGKIAFTIHRKIYSPKRNDGNWYSYSLAPNQHSNTLFIVDEASMIPDNSNGPDANGNTQNLLQDLIDYVKAGVNCRMLLVGDNAQLPPVGMDKSPALDIKLLAGYYGLRAGHFELTEVVRQEKESGILFNATNLREQIRENGKFPAFRDGFPDFERVAGSELGDKLSDAYNESGPEEVVVVCRSNRSANNYNRQIRFGSLWMEDEIAAGDYLMGVKNNYFWLEKDSPVGFIANGDLLRITRVIGFEECYGFRFANIAALLVDYPDHPAIELKVVLDSLYTEAPALTREQSNDLYKKILEAHPEADTKTAKHALIAKSEYYQALQVKFAYAVTCHKAQGGQWKKVFVDQGFITEEKVDLAFLRWLYTAITRATEKVYLVNFKDEFFEG
ncbi:MAG: AAA family ATPase [Bacteroidetes bacterium]|nr:AAA family ATPase [Bacteroidota bacterium]